jgi:hypothetical protein
MAVTSVEVIVVTRPENRQGYSLDRSNEPKNEYGPVSRRE